jgi:hypothetical protein
LTQASSVMARDKPPIDLTDVVSDDVGP